MTNPLVAIRCITYNHEPYIRDALEGFVMQKTNFPFVAIVHDDASTDGTAAIIREYAEKYPDIIKPIYETENQYSKKGGSLGRIMDKACEETSAKYIAMCEGDDYWIDPLKLQKQVDFLESHPDYSMCCSAIKLKTLDGNLIIPSKEIYGEISYEHLLMHGNQISTLTTLFRSDEIIKYHEYIKNNADNKLPLTMGDFPLWLFLTSRNKAYKLKDTLGVYRIINNSASHPQNKSNLFYFKLCGYEIRESFANRIFIKYWIKFRKSLFIIKHVLKNPLSQFQQIKYIIYSRYF